MKSCTFFGHSDTSYEIKPHLTKILIELIENDGVALFYMGNHGAFDYISRNILKELSKRYPHIKCYVVLSYMPNKKTPAYKEEFFDTIIPDGVENAHPKEAIVKRNKWMIDQSDYVITCVARSFGGAARFKAIAEKRGKMVINIE